MWMAYMQQRGILKHMASLRPKNSDDPVALCFSRSKGDGALLKLGFRGMQDQGVEMGPASAES